MRGRTFQANFAMGAIDEDVHGRVDLQIYTDALGAAANFIPAVIGSARRRPGFADIGAPRDQDVAIRQIPFRRSIGDQLSLEFGDLYVRFRTAAGELVMDGAVPYEIESPYAAADLAGLRHTQSNDVIYLTHKSRLIRPRVLQRSGTLAASTWAFVDLTPRNGPWRNQNADLTKTIEASAIGPVGDVITLEANFDAFVDEHVGGLWRFKQNDGSPPVRSWIPDEAWGDWEICLSDGKVYRTPDLTTVKSANTPPIHETGTVSDGQLDWEYLHDGAGIVRIESVVSPTEATATVIALLPAVHTGTLTDKRADLPDLDIAFPPTPYWTEGAWSDLRGWPGDVAFTDDDRLMFSGTAETPGRWDATRNAGYGPDWADFKPALGTGRVEDDNAVRKTLEGGAEPIEWLRTAAYPMVGTKSKEYFVGGATPDESVTPAGTHIRMACEVGSSDVPPIVAFEGVVFVARGRRGLHYVKVDAATGREEKDLALFVEWLADRRIAEIAWAGKPDKILWIRTDDGGLISVTFDPRQNAFGWVEQPLAGGFLVESLLVIEGDDGRDTLQVGVYREKDGGPQRRIWRIQPRWRRGAALTTIRYLDGCVIHDAGTTTTLGGLAHLAGEEVRVFGDGGAFLETATVSAGGEVELAEPVNHAVTGLAYTSFIESLPLDAGGPAGTLGMKQRVLAVAVSMADCVDVKVSYAGGPPESMPATTGAQTPRSHVFEAKVGGATGREPRIRAETNDVWPATLRNIRSTVDAND